MTDVEQMCKDLKCDAPRVTKELIESRIKGVEFTFTEVFGTRFVHCYLLMDNGFVANGRPSACVDPANYREEIGKKIAYENTFETLWALEGYRLSCELKGV